MNGAVKASLFLLPLLLSIAAAEYVTVTAADGAKSTVFCDRFHKTGFWDVDIDNRPALPPACGPPISRDAIRDRSKLPAQICGIVGSYIFCVFVVGSLLLTIGRRMRRGAETSPATLEIEMVNPNKRFDPVSPVGSQRSWIKGFSRLKVTSSANSKVSSNPTSPAHHWSPAVESVASFDNKVLQTDQESRQAEMDRLYAAVMVHDEQKRASEVRSSQVPTLRSQTNSVHIPDGSPPKQKRQPLRVQIVETPQDNSPRSPSVKSMVPPKSPYKAIYPPYPSQAPTSGLDPSPGGWSATSGQSPLTPMTPMSPVPQRVMLPNDMYPASPPPQARQMQLPSVQAQEQPPPTPRSFMRRQSESRESISTTSTKSKKMGLKNLRISGPVRPSHDDSDDREPLTPRFIPQNPPSPPSPPDQRHVQPPTPHTAKSMDSDYASERLDEPKPLPMSAPQRPMAPPSRRPANLSLTLPSSPGPNKSAASSTNSLPFRAFQNASTSEVSLGSSNPLSPGPIKTTFLERKINKLGGGQMTGRTPRTGVPMTPYSPYMPFTPMTPVTPGLVSRKERKERVKAEGRKVIAEEDLVKDSEDMWDAGY